MVAAANFIMVSLSIDSQLKRLLRMSCFSGFSTTARDEDLKKKKNSCRTFLEVFFNSCLDETLEEAT